MIRSPLQLQLIEGPLALSERQVDRSERLVDNLLSAEVSASGHAERYGRGKTSHTIHVWWARRPHAAMRALVLASILPADTENSSDLIARIATQEGEGAALDVAREAIRTTYESTPRVLDMFAGGGTIPYEAARLGLDVLSFDSNPLSTFIQRCNLVYASEFDPREMSKLVREYGAAVLNRLRRETDYLFPLRVPQSANELTPEVPFGYYWSYSVRCKSCGYTYSLLKRPWLSKKKGRECRLSFLNDDKKQTHELVYRKETEAVPLDTNWVGRSSGTSCPNCGTVNPPPDFSNIQDDLVAAVCLTPKGKRFSAPPRGSVPDLQVLGAQQEELLKQLGLELPSSELPRWSGIVNPAIYGIDRYQKVYNPRQRMLLLELVRVLRENHLRMVSDVGEPKARAVTGYLSGLIDQLVDWNSRLSMWIPQNEQVGRAFCGPGVSMLWDYMETDPLLNGPANLWAKLKRITAGVEAGAELRGRVNVRNALAQRLPVTSDSVDAIVADPPYYDNIYYSVLSEFFYVWKRLLMREIEPDLFSNPTINAEGELVASANRAKARGVDAHSEYVNQLSQAFGEAWRVLKTDGVFCLVFSHSSRVGWDALLRAYRASGLCVSSAQPFSIERKQRPRAMNSEAVNTTVALVARKSRTCDGEIEVQDVRRAVTEANERMTPVLRDAGWTDNDISLAIFANGVAKLASASGLAGFRSTMDELAVVEECVATLFRNFKLASRRSI